MSDVRAINPRSNLGGPCADLKSIQHLVSTHGVTKVHEMVDLLG
jgi:hypothetical protein